MSNQLKVMVSSTVRDLPAHRREVLDACLRQGMFPLMMEHLPASDAEAVSVSLDMVEKADVYVGVLAHRYGYVPQGRNPRRVSISEMEYDAAVRRNIPRLIFIADRGRHPSADFNAEDIDTGEGAARLEQFKRRVEAENVVNFFKSPEDLRAHVINSLSHLRVVALLHWGLKKGRQSAESVGCHGSTQDPSSSAFPALPPLRRAVARPLLSQQLSYARRAAHTVALP